MYDRRQRCYKETCIRPYLTSLRGELYEFWGIADFEKMSYGHTCTKMKIIHTTTIEKKKQIHKRSVSRTKNVIRIKNVMRSAARVPRKKNSLVHERAQNNSSLYQITHQTPPPPSKVHPLPEVMKCRIHYSV